MITQNALLSSHADLTRRPFVDYSAPGGWLLVSLYRGNKVHGRLREEAWRSVTYAESDHGRTRQLANVAFPLRALFPMTLVAIGGTTNGI